MYHIQLLWHSDKIVQVDSNHSVALRILDQVVNRLDKKYQENIEVFYQQEQKGIIEEIFVSTQAFRRRVWIPHWPVYKTNPTATTKIRPVFNRQFKDSYLRLDKRSCLLRYQPHEGHA